MSIKENMQNAAERLIENFAKPNGYSIYHRFISESYDTVNGNTVLYYEEEPIYMVFSSITEKEISDESFRNKHEKANVAGLNLFNIPNKKDIIEKPDGSKHRIISIKTDMYKANYTFYIEMKNVKP